MRLGNWKVGELIARNGPVTVYRASSLLDNKPAVLKSMLTEGRPEEHQLSLFRREISINSVLKHRNIVSYLDSGNDDRQVFCVFEYCNGGNLADTLQRLGRKLMLEESIRIILQVLEGLDYAHTAVFPGSVPDRPAGIVHRDIKPENILLNYNAAGQYTAKIADFGLSKAFHQAGDGLTRTGDIGGSLAYICRQQIINYKYARAEVDVWSTAAVWYFLLTGMPPRGSRAISFTNLLSTPPRPVRELRPELDDAAALVLDQALDDSGRLYFRAAADLKQALLSLLPKKK